MTDEWYSATHQPVRPRSQPRPGELLFEFVRQADHLHIRCELRFHGEWGVEAQVYRNGQFCIGRRFPTKAEAVAWAEAERDEYERGRE